MKTILILAMGFFALSASARTQTKFFSHTVSAATEELVLEKVEAVIPQIVSGKIKSPFQYGMCWPNNDRTIKVKGVSITKHFNVDSYGNLNPYYTGSIRYLHKKCRDND